MSGGCSVIFAVRVDVFSIDQVSFDNGTIFIIILPFSCQPISKNSIGLARLPEQ